MIAVANLILGMLGLTAQGAPATCPHDISSDISPGTVGPTAILYIPSYLDCKSIIIMSRDSWSISVTAGMCLPRQLIELTAGLYVPRQLINLAAGL